MNEKNFCSICGAVLDDEEVIYFDNRIICEDCYMDHTSSCDHCGERIWNERSRGDDNYTLCERCFENEFTTCDTCGRLIPNSCAYYDDDDYPHCQECYSRISTTPIKSYNYKPEPIFYGSGDLFLGVELEIDKGGEDNSNAEDILDIGNYPCERIYCKHDGSLSEGFEIVSHPMTLDYHMNEMNWIDIFSKAIYLDYRSHNTCTCGLHIHCNRNMFGQNREIQELAIGRIVFFVEKHWNELVNFSRRKIENLERWAARYETISSTAGETYKKAKDKRMGRYVAVNLQNHATIEFRLFRGTLRHSTFIATLQLIDHLCRLATYCTDREFENMSWGNFVLGINKEKYPQLVEYLKSRRLYVNEIAEESEEV